METPLVRPRMVAAELLAAESQPSLVLVQRDQTETQQSSGPARLLFSGDTEAQHAEVTEEAPGTGHRVGGVVS